MQEAEVLLVLAEIAGVFVGFRALIAVRSGGASDARELLYIRSVLSIGVWVVVVALTPVTLGAYDIGERQVWLVSSLVALVGYVVMSFWLRSTPEMQEVMASFSRAQMMREGGSYTFLFIPMLAALIVVALGLFPDHDAALFLTVVVLGLFGAALTLLWLVYEHGRSATVVPDETEAPAE